MLVKNNTKLLVVDDHRLFRESLCLVLQQHDRTMIITEASNPSEAESIIRFDAGYDLVLFDLGFPTESIWSTLTAIRRDHPEISVGILSGSHSPASMQGAKRHKVDGFISKTSSAHELSTGIQSILAGQFYVSADIREQFFASDTTESDTNNGLLTPRQQDVLELLAEALSNKGIANKLNISESTVKQHVSRIIELVGARNRTGVVVKAQGYIGCMPKYLPRSR